MLQNSQMTKKTKTAWQVPLEVWAKEEKFKACFQHRPLNSASHPLNSGFHPDLTHPLTPTLTLPENFLETE